MTYCIYFLPAKQVRVSHRILSYPQILNVNDDVVKMSLDLDFLRSCNILGNIYILQKCTQVADNLSDMLESVNPDF